MTDLMGPLAPSKFYGNRYMAPHIDLHQQTVDVVCMPSKDRYRLPHGYAGDRHGPHLMHPLGGECTECITQQY